MVDSPREVPSVRPTVAVGAVVFSGEGGVLLVRRAKAPLEGHWTLPGGSLELGETLAEATSREVREETGLTVAVGPLVEVYEHQSATEDGRPMFHYVILDYLCEQTGGRLAAGSDASAVAWVRDEAFDKYGVNEPTRRVIARARLMAAELDRDRARLTRVVR